MSLEDQYDAWVRSVTGTGRHSATKQDRDAAQNSLNAMQAQLDALAESQKRQKSAADALNAVQRAGAATADPKPAPGRPAGRQNRTACPRSRTGKSRPGKL